MSDVDALAWLAPGLPLVFAGTWSLASAMLGSAGGWRSLATSYAAPRSSVAGATLWLQTGRLGSIRYKNCLVFAADRSALSMSVLLPFRVGHPSLVVPWRDISASEHPAGGLRYVDVRFAKHPDVVLRIARPLAERLLALGGDVVRIASAG